MIGITQLTDEPFKRKTYTDYNKCSEYEKHKIELGFKRIKEYADFYLYGKYDYDGNLLYRECFSKFDIDGVKSHKQKGCHGAIFKY